MESSASYTELVTLGAKPAVLTNPKPIRRGPSYSDSFLVLHAKSTEAVDLASIVPVILEPLPLHPAAKWCEKGLSILFHLFLISVFESVFFRLFIAKSEDKGILTTVQNLMGGVESTCRQWSANETAVINDIVSVFVNSTQVQIAASQALVSRTHYNAAIFARSWIYVGALGSAVVVLFSVLRWRQWIPTSHLRALVLENVGLVLALGLYEYMFFRTVIYEYDSVSVPEIEGNLVRTLQDQCGLF